MANFGNLMSFSSDEEDNVAVNSEVSWLTVLSSEFSVSARGRSGTESTRSLSPNFCPSDSHPASACGNNRGYLEDYQRAVKTETRSSQSSFPSDSQRLNWVEFPSDSDVGRDSLFNQQRQLRTSRSWDELTPPTSPVKKRNNIPQVPQGGFANYHKFFRPPSELLDREGTVSYNGSGVFKNNDSPPSYTSNLFVTLNSQHYGVQSTNQSVITTASSNSSSEHPYGSITLKLTGELSTRESREEVAASQDSLSDDLVFPEKDNETSEQPAINSSNIRPLKVQLPPEETHKGPKEKLKKTVSRRKCIPPPRPPLSTLTDHSFSSSFPDKKSPTASESSKSSLKFIFYGDGLFDVAKERNEEATAFSEMMSRVRSNVHWDDQTNPGHVISPTIPYDYETFPHNTEAKLAIYTEGRKDTLEFIFSVHSQISKVIELALSCLLDDSKLLNLSGANSYVLKVCGRSEYLQANSVLIQYGYVQECVEFGREVELVLLESWQVLRQLARTEDDDIDDSVPRNYKEFFDCPVSTAVSEYGLTVLLEAFNDELVKLKEETTNQINPRFEPSRVIQSVKAICATLASLETKQVINSVQNLRGLQSTHALGREVPDEAVFYDAVEKLQAAVLLLIETYCDAFDTDFVPTRAERPKLAGSVEVTAMTDNFGVHVAFANRLPVHWNQDFDRFEVQCGVYYGGRLSCPVEVTQQRQISRHFFNQLRWDEWLQFKIQVRQLPRESRLCLTLYGIAVTGKGNSLNTTRIPLGWVAIPLFDFKAVLVSGTHLLGLWPDDVANPVGSCTSNLLHPSSVMLQVEFEPYLADIVFPNFETNGWLAYDETDRCEAQARNADVYKPILEKDLFNELKPEESELLWEHRYYCKSVPKVLPLILSAAPSWEYQYLPVIYSLLASWAPLKPVDAMELLKVSFPDTRVRATAVDWMEALVDDELCDYLPQLVQALKYEIYHDSALVQFLVRRALASVRVMHYLFWYLKDNISDPQFGQRFQIILGGLLSICGNAQRTEFTKQDEIVHDLIDVAQHVKGAKDSLRTNILQQKLAVVVANMFTSVRLPISPSYEVKVIDVKGCGYFTSNSAPLKLIFKNSDPFGEDVHAMFKIGDDMRQDRLIMQLVGIMNKIWLREGIDLKMITYKCIATGIGMGMVEIVKESVTLREIHTELGLTGSFKDEPIARWIQKYNPGEESYHQAVENFTASCAGYCVATYVLGICDRHNDNIMIKRSGQLFHIDFAKILGNATMFGSFRRDRAPFVLTSDMVLL